MPADVPGYVVPVLMLPDGLEVPAVPEVPALPDVSVPAPVVPALPLPPLLVLLVMLTGDPLCGSCARI